MAQSYVTAPARIGRTTEVVVPKRYERIRDSYKAAGKSDAEAKRLAAMAYNAHRKPGQKPVTGKHGLIGRRMR